MSPLPDVGIEYHSGDPVPDGWVVATRRRDGLMTAGAVLASAGYLLPYFAAMGCDSGECGPGSAVLPLAGPLLQLGDDGDRIADGTRAALIVSALAQAGGVALFVTGAALQKRVLVPAGVPVSAAPVIGPSFAGVAIGGSTF